MRNSKQWSLSSSCPCRVNACWRSYVSHTQEGHRVSLFIYVFIYSYIYGAFLWIFCVFFFRQTCLNLIDIHLLYFQWRGKTRTYVYICVCCICLRSPSWKMPVQFPVQNSCLVPIRTVIYIFFSFTVVNTLDMWTGFYSFRRDNPCSNMESDMIYYAAFSFHIAAFFSLISATLYQQFYFARALSFSRWLELHSVNQWLFYITLCYGFGIAILNQLSHIARTM